jgi:hypothetical protein
MPRPLSALAAAGVAALTCIVLTASAASTRHAAAPSCTLLVAKSEILASDLPMRVKHDAAGHAGSGIDRLMCRDLTRDSRKDMLASVFGGDIGVEAWVFFRASPKGWRLAFERTGLVRAKIQVAGGGVIETDPVFRAGDQRPCCPTGGQKHYRFKWKRGKMAKVRVWHTRPG